MNSQDLSEPFRTESIFRFGLLLAFAVLPVLLVAGCGKQSDSSDSTGEKTSAHSGIDQQITRLISALNVAHEEYGEAFENGELSDQAEYMEAKMGIEDAQSVYEKNREKLAKRNAGHTDQIGSNLEEARSLIQDKEAVSEVNELLSSTIDLLKEMHEVADGSSITAYRKQVAELDAMLHVERQVNGYRIGIFASTAKKIFTPDGSSSDPSADSFYLGVTLREKRTKRYLPGSTVKVSIGGETVTLQETWGDVHHYGTHLSSSIDGDAEVKVSVSPPAYGRHAEMKSSYREPASVTFGIRTADLDDHPVFDGPEPQALASDYDVGSGIIPAIEESMELKTAGPYKVGFIVEGAEPFWTWSDGELNAHTGEGENQNHLEIVLLDKNTNEPIPHASISLELKGGDTEKTVDLYPLLAEFYHYGTNAPVPAGNTYTVNASIKAPGLHTFEQNRFTNETVSFEWTKSE